MSTKHAIECLCAECCRIDMDQHLIINGINPNRYSMGEYQVAPERTRYSKPGQTSGTGTVRKPSEPQLKFLRSLLETKDLEGMKFPVGVNVGILKNLESISLTGCRDLIDRLLKQPTIRTVQVVATPKQLAFWKSLINQKCGPAEANERLAAQEEFPLSMKEISKSIGELLARKDYVSPSAPAKLAEGMYQKDGKTYKVQRAVAQGSGNLYAKVFDELSEKFVYAPGMVRKLAEADRMNLEQAKEFGDLYGICCRCGRALTDEDSIARGIGPVCATKF